MKYGIAPEVISLFKVDLNEFMFFMYLPIKMPGSKTRMEDRLSPLYAMVKEVLENEKEHLHDKYIYLTIKHMFHPEGYSHNRPNWHSDGFGSDDINYIFYSNTPTEFCVQEYKNISADDKLSMIQFEEQSDEKNIITYPSNTLLKLSPYNIHRIGYKAVPGPRIFIKISISKNQYRLKGNSHNYLFDYNWDLQERQIERNVP